MGPSPCFQGHSLGRLTPVGHVPARGRCIGSAALRARRASNSTAQVVTRTVPTAALCQPSIGSIPPCSLECRSLAARCTVAHPSSRLGLRSHDAPRCLRLAHPRNRGKSKRSRSLLGVQSKECTRPVGRATRRHYKSPAESRPCLLGIRRTNTVVPSISRPVRATTSH